MKIKTTTLASSGISPQNFEGGFASCDIECAGTSAGTAAIPLTSDGVFEYTVNAHRVNDSNYGVRFPQQVPLPTPSKVKIVANGPSDKSITVYFGPAFQLYDGSSSLVIDCGKIKTFMYMTTGGLDPAFLAVDG